MPPQIIGLVPPWALLAALIGVMHGALFHLVAGQQVRQLPLQILVGLCAGILGGFIGTMIPPAILEIGDTNLISTSVAPWALLAIARLFRFC